MDVQDFRQGWDARSQILGAVAFALCVLVLPVQAKEPLTLQTGVWAPYVNEQDETPGVMTQVVRAAFESINQPVLIKRLPWDRVRRQTNKEGAISFGWSWGRERSRAWYYSDTLMTGDDIFAVRRSDSIEWNGLTQLADYRLGVVQGYHLPSDIEAIRDELDIIAAPKDENLLRMLLADRLDMALINYRVARHLMEDILEPEQADAIRLRNYQSVASYTLHLVCHKTTENCAETVLEFNEGLRRIRDDGTWQRISQMKD